MNDSRKFSDSRLVKKVVDAIEDNLNDAQQRVSLDQVFKIELVMSLLDYASDSDFNVLEEFVEMCRTKSSSPCLILSHKV